jgi:uncharacterized membrane protein YqaE (UPF0057 family)
MRINRLIVWALLGLILLTLLSGYGLTNPRLITTITGGLLDHNTSLFIHTTFDPYLTVLLFIHVLIELKFTFMRWGFKKESLLNILLLLLGITSVVSTFYLETVRIR